MIVIFGQRFYVYIFSCQWELSSAWQETGLKTFDRLSTATHTRQLK